MKLLELTIRIFDFGRPARWLGVLLLGGVIAPLGADAGDHWAFQPVRSPSPPRVGDEAWIRNPIDRFVLAKLEEKGIRPSEEAERHTLIRRASLDLIGLPPSFEEIEAFLADREPGAFSRVVDLLLESPHYGEKWGRHWLDQARYADSNGYTIDGPRVMWPYRDWVIDALNSDMPFDQFTIEQLAGDLLPNPTRDQLVATGFHRNSLINQEGGTDDEQFRVESVIDRVNTTGAVWLGLTVGCAQCHAHKYDPISQEEFYGLYAFFNSTEDKNNVGPTVRLRPPGHAETAAKIEQWLSAGRARLAEYDRAHAGEQTAWEKELLRADVETDVWQPVEILSVKSDGGAKFKRLEDGSHLVSDHPRNDVYRIAARSPAGRVTAVRLDVLPHASLPKNGPGLAGNGNFVMTGFELAVGSRKVRLSRATSDHAQPRFPIENAIDGKKDTGWAINTGKGDTKKMNEHHWAFFFPEEPVSAGEEPLKVSILHESGGNGNYLIGRFQLSVTDVPAELLTTADPEALLTAARTETGQRTGKQRELLLTEFRNQDARRRSLAVAVDRLENEKQRHDRAGVATMVMREMDKPRDTRVHIRGDFLRKGEPVSPGVPDVFPALGQAKQSPDRLDLAKWLVDPANPLTSRVTVNRIWMRYFGKGLVETENDFGTQGTPPTHPELLDWLASEFIRQGGALKKLHKLIVTSATYRQDSAVREDLAHVDPTNKWLARQNRLRVDAEQVRDMALAVSGRLSREIGGPSVYPPQPDGVYNFTQNKKKGEVTEGPQKYRRTLYTFFYRSAPHPMLTTFDVPDLSQVCTARRRSNTPLQSLNLANAEGMFELARSLGARIWNRGEGSVEGRMNRAFRLCLARPPHPDELQRLLDYFASQQSGFAGDLPAAGAVAGKPADSGTVAERAAWVMTARTLMNLDEFITRE